MGLDIRTAEFLLHCRQQEVDFSTTCTLGRQTVMLLPSERALIRKWTGVKLKSFEYADPFFKALGAERVHALDSSSYEGADIIHNLNQTLPPSLCERFDCLIDGGTLEHVFDFPSALRDSLRMVRPGGHLIICNIANNFMGHGFYQFSPELFFSAFTPENGCEMVSMRLNEGGIWYQPHAPQHIRRRVEAQSAGGIMIYACAKRIAPIVPFATPPHQSDYIYNLDISSTGSSEVVITAPMTLRQKIAGAFPRVKKMVQQFREFKRGRILPACTLLEEIDGRWRRRRGRSYRNLRNRTMFHKIGRRLYKSSMDTSFASK